MAEPASGPLAQHPRVGAARHSRRRLGAEFLALYVVAPVAIAIFLPPAGFFPALFVFTLAGLVLLWRTGGFDWRQLLRGWSAIDWRLAAGFTALTLALSVLILLMTRPEALFGLPRRDWRFMLLIWALYPLLSALPQELIFRPLFFHRFGGLFAGPGQAVLANAAVFSLAHLMYWSWIVAAMTFAGGVVFALAYLRRGLPWAWLLHALAGNALFTAGMGAYFYTGNVTRPF